MGISSMPAPSDGVMTTLLMNTVVTISILKAIVRSVLRYFGVRTAEPEAGDAVAALGFLYETSSTAERFRNRFKPVRFGSAAAGRHRRAVPDRSADCSVCLSKFEQDSVVNRLDCGHLFHRGCLEKWLDYQHITCPLCRTAVLPRDDLASASSSSASSWAWF